MELPVLHRIILFAALLVSLYVFLNPPTSGGQFLPLFGSSYLRPVDLGRLVAVQGVIAVSALLLAMVADGVGAWSKALREAEKADETRPYEPASH